MAFPNKKEIYEVLKDLKKSEGTLLLAENPTPLEKFRWELCQKFLKYKKSHGITQKDLASKLEVDESKVSKILRHRIDEFSTDRLVNLYCKIQPKTVLKVS